VAGRDGVARPLRRLAWPAALACCALLAACGKGGSQGATTVVATGHTLAPPTASTPGTTAPQRPAPKAPKGGGSLDARALAFATAVNLRASDVPGFNATAKSQRQTTPAEERLVRELAACAGGLGGALGGGEQASPQFKRKVNVLQVSVSSNVSFLPSAANAGAQLKVLRSPHTRECLATYLRRLLAQQRYGSGARVSHVAVAQGTPPAAGTSGGFGWRLTAIFTVKHLNVPFYLDILGFLDRRAEVSLVSSGEALPFPAAIEERLFELLLARSRTHTP
jgi:hypothetical protein